MKPFAPPPQPSPALREREQSPRVIDVSRNVAVPLSREAGEGEGGGLGAFRYALIALTLLGAALRLYAAQGDLWLDEIWTLNLLERAHSFGDVFIGLHHDNNHVANSAWLYLIGPNAPVPLMRLAAIAFGTLAIPAAAAAAASRRYCGAAGLIAAFVFATSYFFVHYGSEARGYAGMTLAVLLAYGLVDAILAEGASWRRLLALAAAIGFGTFSHLTMIEASGALALTAMLRFRRSTLGRAVAIGAVAGLASLPALFCFAYGALAPDFQVGAMVPLSPAIFAEGVAGMARATLGFPRGVDDFALLGAAGLLALGLLAVLPAERRVFPAIAVFGLPLLHIAAGLPSQQYPRFHATAAIGLTLLAAEGCAALYRAGALRRGAAAVLLGAFAIGDAGRLADFYRDGRGHYADAVKIMAERKEAPYAVDFARGETKAVVAYHARKLGVVATMVSPAEWCATPPAFLLVVDLPDSLADHAERRSAGPRDCRADFLRRGYFPASGLSGFAWTLYEREEVTKSAR
ncbi:hypothetical protein EDE12_10874 [Methylosinus sp. sav-2]|uniref:hypothetical protein n=1 Tax=Methylosinus sp. sav-2 TaxID=2485168 RepID=UPI00106641E8|nr:hypothetical protein [Methylosinus sp. sav-2]TDX63166.1 hypothetical protein EDE12_10874 [Methylosinus sp. sav-2]